MSSVWPALAALAFTLAVGAPAEAAPAPAPTNPYASCGPTILKAPGLPWRCTFNDEFNGTTLDPAKWTALTTAKTGLSGHGDCWVARPWNIAVGGGALHLTTRREPTSFTCTSERRGPSRVAVTSGAVTTLGRFAQTYGRWEVRARFPHITTAGSHGALWLYPATHTYGPWPASGEIDIAEFYSLYPDRAVPYVHYRTPFRDPTVTNTECLVADPWNFHRYVLVWVPGRITMAIDGRLCLDHHIRDSLRLPAVRPFDRPFFVNLAQTLGVQANKPTRATPLPATTVVDYVRVWS